MEDFARGGDGPGDGTDSNDDVDDRTDDEEGDPSFQPPSHRPSRSQSRASRASTTSSKPPPAGDAASGSGQATPDLVHSSTAASPNAADNDGAGSAGSDLGPRVEFPDIPDETSEDWEARLRDWVSNSCDSMGDPEVRSIAAAKAQTPDPFAGEGSPRTR
jgi:hypothetical protein